MKVRAEKRSEEQQEPSGLLHWECRKKKERKKEKDLLLHAPWFSEAEKHQIVTAQTED